MRACEIDQLALKPFAPDHVVFVVGEDRLSRRVALGGAGRFEGRPAMTLFVPAETTYPIGSSLTVNMLSAARPANAEIHLEESKVIHAPHIAESRLAFDGVVLATGSLGGEHEQRAIVVVRVLATYQSWPRGCAAA